MSKHSWFCALSFFILYEKLYSGAYYEQIFCLWKLLFKEIHYDTEILLTLQSDDTACRIFESWLDYIDQCTDFTFWSHDR